MSATRAPEISAADLLAEIETGTDLQLLDVRAPERALLGHIDASGYRNIPGIELARAAHPADLGLVPARPVAVVCDRGLSSRQVTAWLRQQGYDATSLRGGMVEWMRHAVPRDVAGVRGLDRLIQLDRVGKGALGYLAVRGGEALAVDPGRELGPWHRILRETNARLVAVVDTHCHADYLSGGAALAAAHGAPYRLHCADAVDPYEGRPARLAFEPISEGDSIAVGEATFTVEHLPGHTEGSVALRLANELAFTGDLLFVGSVGRPDLADRTAEWTERLWRSLERVRAQWPADLRILPAHYAGDDERAAGRVVEARMRELAGRNLPFAIADATQFRSWIGERVGSFPDAYRQIKRANLGLVRVDDDLADELEAGKHQCALAPMPA